MMYLIRKTDRSGDVLYRKAGLSDSSRLWSKSGKCWTSLGAFKVFLAQQKIGRNWRDKGSHNITKNYPDDVFEVLEINLDNATITAISFEEWCENNES